MELLISIFNTIS